MTLLLGLLVGGGLASCSDKDDGEGDSKEIANPIASVVAVDGSKTANAVISDADKTIKFAFEELSDLTSVSVTINMTKGALLKTPGKATSTLNLSAPYSVVLHNGVKEVTYTMTATPKEILQPVVGAKVGDTDAVVEGQLITIGYKPEMEINAMTFDFSLLSGATVKSPADKTFNLELEDGKLVVTYQGEDYNYTVKVKDYVDPLLSKGWTNVTSSYGTLPNYIKVYKNEDLLNNAATKSIGYIAIMSPGKSTMGALGAGKDNKKSIYTFASEEPSWNRIYGRAADLPRRTIRAGRRALSFRHAGTGQQGCVQDGLVAEIRRQTLCVPLQAGFDLCRAEKGGRNGLGRAECSFRPVDDLMGRTNPDCRRDDLQYGNQLGLSHRCQPVCDLVDRTYSSR